VGGNCQLLSWHAFQVDSVHFLTMTRTAIALWMRSPSKPQIEMTPSALWPGGPTLILATDWVRL
jgi:hypothetical protein